MTAAKVVKSSNRGSKPGERRGGRKKGVPNKATAVIKDIAGQYSQQAVETLVSIMAGGEGIPAAARVTAAREILDRAHGKPPQALTGEGGGAMELVTRIERAFVSPRD